MIPICGIILVCDLSRKYQTFCWTTVSSTSPFPVWE
jgi:hypothetical protein